MMHPADDRIIVRTMVDFAVSDPAAEATLDRIVRCVREVVEPELIMLFGSRASGEARDDSDYDLMIVVPDESALATGRDDIRRRLSDNGISADVIARTPTEYDHNQRDPGFLEFVIARQGRILYATGRVPQRSAGNLRVREVPPREGLDRWIRRASSDLRSAEQLLDGPEPIWDAICFHAHASAEKFLKAMVVRAGTFPPPTHDLKSLLALQPPEVRQNAGVLDACAVLMSVLPRARYPHLAEPTPDQARQAVAASRLVRDVLAAKLSRRELPESDRP
jgi:HEPN domain-containing protein/predicted nucleotidyltransferase